MILTRPGCNPSSERLRSTQRTRRSCQRNLSKHGRNSARTSNLLTVSTYVRRAFATHCMGLLYQFFPHARDNIWTSQEGNYRSVLRALILRRATETALAWTSLPTEKEKLAWVTTFFRGPFPPHVIYYFLDNESGGDNLMLLSYRDLANFLNECTPHDIAHHIFHLTRLLVTARYLEDRLQSLFDCYRICLRDKRQAETEASNARGGRDFAHAALQLRIQPMSYQRPQTSSINSCSRITT